ncbi:MAG TPA: hypothetical protein VLM80_05175 [Anaerolineales bacterium]|nr:hypothetical protein [Anaerolineales bacterium]
MIDFGELYAKFRAPISELDCGDRCAPYNEKGIPFCCDIRHAVPTAYLSEWDYLEQNTDLWRKYTPDSTKLADLLEKQTPAGQELIVCLGHLYCQREFRSLTCRSFPFFPYINRQGEFIGLSYYWEYEDRCWVISHLNMVSGNYRLEFIDVFDFLFKQMPDERETFRQYSILMRRIFGRKNRAIPLLHRNGHAYKISPHNGRTRRYALDQFPKIGVYQIAADLPFPDEI